MVHTMQGIPDTKPATTDIGLGPDKSKIGSKPDTFKVGGLSDQSEPLLHKARDNQAAHGTGMGLSASAQDAVWYS